MVTIRNHYLPKFYLEYFLPKKEPRVFWVYDKEGGEPRAQTPVNTGIERHLYNVIWPDSSVDDYIERKVFGPIESIAKPIIDRWLKTHRISESEIPKIAAFLAFMNTRVPRNIETIREVGAVLATCLMKDLAKKPEEIKKYLSRLKKEREIKEIKSIKEMQNILENFEENFHVSMSKKPAMAMSLLLTEEVDRQLLNMNWCIYRAPRDSFFITCDSPLVCFVLDKNGMATFGGGFGLPNAEVTFPLSPDECLYLDRKQTNAYRAISKKIVKEINRRTAWMAERFIISMIRTNCVKRIVEESSVTIKEPKMDKKKLIQIFKSERLSG